MRLLITGLGGTVAPSAAQLAEAEGHQVVRWNRAVHDPADRDGVRHLIEQEQPQALLHLATGDPAWAEQLAQECGARSIRFVQASSVSVFSGQQTGPYFPDSPPTATDDYGAYKAEVERRVAAANPDAIIVRLGWQIGRTPQGNHMAAWAHREATANGGLLRPSSLWFPSCSFLEDTARVLLQLADPAQQWAGGIYQANSNQTLTFEQIIRRLAGLQGANWRVEPGLIPSRDDRMHDPRLVMPALEARLGEA